MPVAVVAFSQMLDARNGVPARIVITVRLRFGLEMLVGLPVVVNSGSQKAALLESPDMPVRPAHHAVVPDAKSAALRRLKIAIGIYVARHCTALLGCAARLRAAYRTGSHDSALRHSCMWNHNCSFTWCRTVASMSGGVLLCLIYLESLGV
jgi:hypothetical protein